MPGSVIARVWAGVGRIMRRPGPAPAGPMATPTSMPLPPTRLRAGGAHFRADEDFMASAILEARRVIAEAGSAHAVTILDLGCGAGRLAYGLIAIEAPIARYEGVDVMAAQIEWCVENVTPRHPGYRFQTIDVYNERYNRDGSRAVADAALPLAGRSIDVAYAYSVFSHLQTADVRAYLHEFARTLVADGVAFVTAFVEDDVADETVNPPDYQHESWGGPLHCVRFSRTHVEHMVREAGLTIDRFDYGQEANGQSRLSLRVVAR